MTVSKTLIPGPVNEGADVSTTPSKTAPGFWVAAGTVSTLVSPGRGARMLISGLTHCLRAWFLLLKYKMSFFLIAWFLGNGRRHKEVKWKRTAGHVCHPSKAKLKYRQDALLFSAYRKSHCAKEMQTYITHHKKKQPQFYLMFVFLFGLKYAKHFIFSFDLDIIALPCFSIYLTDHFELSWWFGSTFSNQIDSPRITMKWSAIKKIWSKYPMCSLIILTTGDANRDSYCSRSAQWCRLKALDCALRRGKGFQIIPNTHSVLASITAVI